MFRVFPNRTSSAPLFEVLVDGSLGFVAVLAAAASTGMLAGNEQHAGQAVFAATGFAFTMAVLQALVGLYRHVRIALGPALIRLALAVLVAGYAVYLALKSFGVDGHPGRLMGMAVLYFVVALVVMRTLVVLCRDAMGAKRVLIVGTGAEAKGVYQDITAAGAGAPEIVGFYSTGLDDGSSLPQSKVFAREQSLVALAAKLKIHEIIVATKEQRGGAMPMEQLLACRSNGIRILDSAAFYERAHAEIPVDSLKASWLVYGDGFVQGPVRRAAKRLFDIVTSSLLLTLGLPVMVLAAIAIKLDSPGPVIYRQQRVGRGGRSFWCLKLRSMRTDAEKDGVARWASKNDSRVTRVGAFLRKTRIDELPQLFSVLRGEMSMVGPRPERPAFVADLRERIPFYDLRHSIKPGVTGWAQVRYSYGSSLEEARRKHQFDLYYVKNNTVWLDVVVLVETVSVVLFREGAR
jgi:sugar transferase (PEP-CTERM system associated)